MAGRDPRHLHRLPVLTNTTALEDRIGLQHREIQSLLVDNQRLAATHVALKQDLAAAQHDLRRLSVVAGQAKAERDAEVREVYERSLKLDGEVRTIDSMGAELARTRADIQELGSVRQELVAELQSIEGEVAKTRSESKRVVDIKADIETFQQEIKKGRVAIENETKTRAKTLNTGREWRKPWLPWLVRLKNFMGSPGYPATYGDPEMVYGGNAYPDAYGMLHQAQGGADAATPYGSVPMPQLLMACNQGTIWDENSGRCLDDQRSDYALLFANDYSGSEM
ncbi:protein FLC EXPRESSOR isoform X2 [Prunus yedoensis var. nudiflora]|uniref:Protein FLC EXPRESSOR isoform X2 n=1 Tax=Prunus yedoensis var. nudiflora TaxID=2094558 RepID=A0A314YPE0_PRUYE|nr:protein FLC EXPRESSOR isoform X2 [Prunus yedoensis var. nudiflora]